MSKQRDIKEILDDNGITLEEAQKIWEDKLKQIHASDELIIATWSPPEIKEVNP